MDSRFKAKQDYAGEQERARDTINHLFIDVNEYMYSFVDELDNRKAIMDFTLKTYRSLLSALRRAGYTFRTFEEFLSVPADGKVVILRHDIDKRPENALRLAQIEHASGVKASYYIRVVRVLGMKK